MFKKALKTIWKAIKWIAKAIKWIANAIASIMLGIIIGIPTAIMFVFALIILQIKGFTHEQIKQVILDCMQKY